MPVIATPRLQLAYELTGPSFAPVVVLSNSLGTTMAMWDDILPALHGRWRVLRYDTRGHGGSPAVDAPVSLDDLAADLASLLDALGLDEAHIAGLSLGGMTAQAFAAAYPRRTTSLVLMATAAHLAPPEMWETRARTVLADGTAAIVDAVIARWFTPAFAASSSEKVGQVAGQIRGIDSRGYAACCRAIRDMDLRPCLGAITAPTLIIAGRDDPATPVAMSEALAAGIAGAELVVVPRAAHLLAIERADAVGPLLAAFLARHDPPASRRVGGAAFDEGVGNRKAVLGPAHVERSLAKAGAFAAPWQDFITRTAWGEMWGDPTLPWKTRSLVTLAMMVALGREEEFKLHVRPALANGVSIAELQALLLHTAIYAGVPATNGAFRWAKDVLGEEAS